MRRTALFAGALATAGCTLLVSTSGLSGDAAGDAGSATEAGGDALPPGDAGGAGDAGPGDAHADGARPFCASLSPAPKLCADFDDPLADVGAGWDEVFRDPPTAGSIEKSEGSAVVRLKAAPQCSYTRLVKKLPTNGKGMRVSFSMRPAAPWPDDTIFLFVGLTGLTTCAALLHLSATDAHLHLQYGSPQQDDIVAWSTTPKLDAWSRVLVAFDDGSVDVSLDGTRAASIVLPVGCAYGSDVLVGLGYHCESGTAEMRYDDVVVDYP